MPSLFQSFFMGGFECSTHRIRSGTRLDLIAATKHDQHALLDYERLFRRGLRVARDGIRWHLIEQQPGEYDFSSALPMVRAAHEAGIQVIWDICHYGWPDDIDPFSTAFVDRFARFARAFAQLVGDESDSIPFYTPVNEISFWSWAGGEVAHINPLEKGRGLEFKTQLVRASIAAIEAIWDVDPQARIVQPEPIIHIVRHPKRPQDTSLVARYNESQYEAWDMLAGRMNPEIGGDPKYLDIIGVNYYYNNQWVHRGRPLTNPEHPSYRPVHKMLQEVYERYKRPIFIAETGREGDARAEWLRYMCEQARLAMEEGVPLEGLCLYPIFDYPGWDDNRHCPCGLWGYADDRGNRPLYLPLAQELERQQALMEDVPSSAVRGKAS